MVLWLPDRDNDHDRYIHGHLFLVQEKRLAMSQPFSLSLPQNLLDKKVQNRQHPQIL